MNQSSQANICWVMIIMEFIDGTIKDFFKKVMTEIEVSQSTTPQPFVFYAAFLKIFCSKFLLQLEAKKCMKERLGPPKVYKRSLLRGVTTLGVYDYVLAWLFPNT